MLSVVAPEKVGRLPSCFPFIPENKRQVELIFARSKKIHKKSFIGFVKCEDERHDMTKINTEFVLEIRDAPLGGMGTGLNRPLEGSTMAVQFWERAAFGVTKMFPSNTRCLSSIGYQLKINVKLPEHVCSLRMYTMISILGFIDKGNQQLNF